MLFRKKEEEAKKSVENIEPYVCKTCGCLVAYLRAHKVLKVRAYNFNTTTDYYCGSCVPVYDKYEVGWLMESDKIIGAYEKYFIRIPEHYKEVDKEGKPLKKKK